MKQTLRNIDRGSCLSQWIVFDFDGTIADTLETVIQISYRIAREFGYESICQFDVEQVRHLSFRERLQLIGFSFWKLPFFIRKVNNSLKSEIQELKPFHGIKEVIVELKKRGYKVGIITGNSKENVTQFALANEMEHLFDCLYSATLFGPATLFGKDKVIRKLLRKEAIEPQQLVYVGDETGDIEAAQKTGVKSIAVSWGFNTPHALAAQNPDYLIQQPQEILDILDAIALKCGNAREAAIHTSHTPHTPHQFEV
ncbi:MAG: HAD hydrolase-like protein [Symploca sp. SIO3E6]|nr:HAD hydrolase-like protein [Caldora sp. SIO3E6]